MSCKGINQCSMCEEPCPQIVYSSEKQSSLLEHVVHPIKQQQPRLTEERTPKENYFPQPQHRNKFCDKYLVDVVVHQNKQNFARKFLNTISPWISKYLRITSPDAVSASATNYVTCPDAVSAAATHDIVCPDEASSSSAALSTADPYVT